MFICSSSSNNAWCLVFARSNVRCAHHTADTGSSSELTVYGAVIAVSLCELCSSSTTSPIMLCCVCMRSKQKHLQWFIIIITNIRFLSLEVWSFSCLLVGRMLAVCYAMPWFTILCDECTEYRTRSTLHRRWGIGHRRWQRIYINVSCTYLDCSVLCDITLYG